jgi:hypothetical protein
LPSQNALGQAGQLVNKLLGAAVPYPSLHP